MGVGIGTIATACLLLAESEDHHAFNLMFGVTQGCMGIGGGVLNAILHYQHLQGDGDGLITLTYILLGVYVAAILLLGFGSFCGKRSNQVIIMDDGTAVQEDQGERGEFQEEPNCSTTSIESPSLLLLSQIPLLKCVTSWTFTRLWMTFLCNVAGYVYFYSSFKSSLLEKIDFELLGNGDRIVMTSIIISSVFCDVFNSAGRVFWAHVVSESPNSPKEYGNILAIISFCLSSLNFFYAFVSRNLM